MIHILEFMELSWKVNLNQSIFGWIFIFFLKKMMCWRSSICNKHVNVIFFFIWPFRPVKLPLGLAAHLLTLWTPGKVKFVFYTETTNANANLCSGVGWGWGRKTLYLNVAYLSLKTVFFCHSKSYLTQNNLHLKCIFFNVQQYVWNRMTWINFIHLGLLH